MKGDDNSNIQQYNNNQVMEFTDRYKITNDAITKKDYDNKLYEKDYKKEKESYIQLLRDLIAEAQKIVDKHKDNTEQQENIKKIENLITDMQTEIKDIDNEQGGTNTHIAEAFNSLCNEENKDISFNVEDKYLDLQEQPNLFYKFILWLIALFSNEKQCNDYINNVNIDSSKALQFVPLQAQKQHVAMLIIDHKNKNICLYEPNGVCFSCIDALKDAKSKEDFIKTICKNEKDVELLCSYKLFNANQINNSDCADQRLNTIFDGGTIYTDIDTNPDKQCEITEENKKKTLTTGDCVYKSANMAYNFLKKYSEYKDELKAPKDYKKFIKDTVTSFLPNKDASLSCKAKITHELYRRKLSNAFESIGEKLTTSLNNGDVQTSLNNVDNKKSASSDITN